MRRSWGYPNQTVFQRDEGVGLAIVQTGKSGFARNREKIHVDPSRKQPSRHLRVVHGVSEGWKYLEGREIDREQELRLLLDIHGGKEW